MNTTRQYADVKRAIRRSRRLARLTDRTRFPVDTRSVDAHFTSHAA